MSPAEQVAFVALLLVQGFGFLAVLHLLRRLERLAVAWMRAHTWPESGTTGFGPGIPTVKSEEYGQVVTGGVYVPWGDPVPGSGPAKVPEEP